MNHYPDAKPIPADELCEYDSKTAVVINGNSFAIDDAYQCDGCLDYFTSHIELDDEQVCECCVEEMQKQIRTREQESRGDLYV